MAIALIALYVLSITPLRLTGAVRRPGRGARAVLRVWGVPLRIKKPKKRPAVPALSLAALRGAAAALGLLIRGGALQRLEADIRLGGGDAAALALFTGLIRTAGGLLPRARVRCVPAWGERTALRGTCILETRLGIIGAAALMGFIAQRRGRNRTNDL